MDSDKLKADLVRDEGEVLHAYDDADGSPITKGVRVQGYATIGVGRMIDKQLNGGISHDESMYLLGNDIAAVTAELDHNAPWWRNLNEPRQRALANMAFNLGTPTLMRFAKMLTALKTGNWQRAHDEALDSRWAGQVGNRAQRIADVFLSGK